MPRNRDEPPAVCVYTVCDESKYLIVRNVPALGCGDELSKLFASYGEIEACIPMDDEECEPFTDVYWTKFRHVNNARFAKRKLGDFIFLGNRLQASYAPHYESLSDTMEKLEGRMKEVLARLNRKLEDPKALHFISQAISVTLHQLHLHHRQVYFPSQSMNQTVQLVREKLNKIQSSVENFDAGPSKKTRVDNRRRI